jgi:hypothetical protein
MYKFSLLTEVQVQHVPTEVFGGLAPEEED